MTTQLNTVILTASWLALVVFVAWIFLNEMLPSVHEVRAPVDSTPPAEFEDRSPDRYAVASSGAFL